MGRGAFPWFVPLSLGYSRSIESTDRASEESSSLTPLSILLFSSKAYGAPNLYLRQVLR